MEKEAYSIDDILSEVKKHKEQTRHEQQIDTASTDAASTGKDNAKDTEEAPSDALPDTEQIAEKPDGEGSRIIEIDPHNTETDEEESAHAYADDASEAADGEEQEESEHSEETKYDDGEIDENSESSDEQEDKMIDLLSLAQEENAVFDDTDQRPAKKSDKEKFSKTKKGKAIISIIIILVIMIIAAGVFAALYANNVLNKVTDDTNGGEDYEMSTYYDGMDFLQEDFPSIEELSAGEVYSYKEYLKQWYQNGDPVSSTHVLNILLIGEDTRSEEISDKSRADSAIIASINIDTKEIHLTSVLRDLYVYYEVDGEGRYGKINAPASEGGMKCYINTLERYYKIAINNYAVVNFNSFPKIIDTLGGVTIKITSAEINEINNHPKVYGNVTIKQSFEGTEGKMKLTGEQALAYCRIRHIDSDNQRANRQKTVLNALFNKMKSSSTLDVVETVSDLAGYVYTGYSKKELISIGNTALRDGWLDFKVETKNVPATENSLGGKTFSVSYNNWIWLADIPKDAYELQMEIYGKSNIVLSDNRPAYIEMGK